ncbi:MAG: outer membrane beta-barrel protein [Chthoniobacteraceae bacterium]|nr:outer membrane beta-barrel protein [Chthoniobacteraceae bacterium]
MESSFNRTQNAPAHAAGHHAKTLRRTLAALSGLVILTGPALAGDTGKQTAPIESAIWEKPAWLTDLSLRVGESYDTNVFLSGANINQDGDRLIIPDSTKASGVNTIALPDGTIAYKNKASAVTTISPKIGVDFAKLLSSDSILKVFTLGYAPDFVIYHDADTESYAAHRITTTVKAKAENVTVALDNAFTYIDGSADSVLFPGGASAYANGTVRERRDQWQDRTKASVKIDVGQAFIRPTFSLLYYDLGTNFKNAALAENKGYSNFIDRYDINGGADLGYNVTKNVAFTLGYRYGHQDQASLPDTVSSLSSTAYTYQTNVSNDYQRVLFGVEGSPLKWLKVEASVGPQFTTYTDSRPYNSGVVALGQIDDNTTDVYAEASVTIAPTATDALVFKYKRWNWVSSTGVNAYLDSLYDASYRHQITKDLQLELGLRASQSDYNPSSLRNDWDYTASAGLKYSITKNLIWDVSYAYDKGHNDQLVGNAVTGAFVDSSTREFERSIVSTGVTWKF